MEIFNIYKNGLFILEDVFKKTTMKLVLEKANEENLKTIEKELNLSRDRILQFIEDENIDLEFNVEDYWDFIDAEYDFEIDSTLNVFLNVEGYFEGIFSDTTIPLDTDKVRFVSLLNEPEYFSQPYENIDAMIKELKDRCKLLNYLPNYFKFEDYIGNLVGTYYY